MPNEPRRVAVFGFDHMHAGDQIAVAQSLSTTALVGVWDSSPERLASVCAELGVPEALQFADVDELVAHARPEIAVICSTTKDHRLHVEYFAERGIHVLLEKPFASSMEDARAMSAVAAEGRVLLGVNWPLAWYPVHRSTHRLLGEGAIGAIREVHYYDGNRGPLLHTHGKVETDPDEVARLKASTWWYQAEAGGGSLRDYLGYGTTLATWFRGGELPSEVSARTHLAPGDEVDEQSVVAASYASGLSTFQTRWGTFTDPWTHQPFPRCGFVIVGDAGTIASFDYADEVRMQTEAHPEGISVPVDVIPEHEAGGLANLVHCLDTGRPLYGPLSWETSLAGHRIVEAAAKSASTGTVVTVEDI
ncbi:Gfo/Idh/MocA family protein [Microbacterium sp. DT81.1]|uniref:Gfo/Idh/MocA family protein n=1 Tax=Microbacterium sp. DT81.1 TaxID=3393413 RepID=UPI003CEA43EF